MRGFLIACALLFTVAQGLESDIKRHQKQFSLFSVVQFDNLACTAGGASSDTPTGVCYTSTECSDKGGIPSGNCANGFGVCCVVKTSTCGTTVAQNCSYIQNPSFPTGYAPTTATNCQFKVKPLGTSKKNQIFANLMCPFSTYLSFLDICQLRLDFLKLQISAKAATGACGTNTLTINGPTARDPPVLCGTITGQHIYVENGRSKDDTTLTFAQQGAASTWNIKVMQIECESVMRAPDGCLQYYTGNGGSFKSLTRGDNLRMLQQTFYNICFRREENMCEIDYSVTTAGSFQLGVGVATNKGQAITNPGTAPNFAMAEALLTIPGAQNLGYGGEKLSNVAASVVDSVVRASTLPFSVLNSGTVIQGNQANQGFDLSWNQVPC